MTRAQFFQVMFFTAMLIGLVGLAFVSHHQEMGYFPIICMGAAMMPLICLVHLFRDAKS